MEQLKQYELTRGTTHWIAWLTDEQLKLTERDGWVIYKAYKTVLVRDKDGHLVEPKNLA